MTLWSHNESLRKFLCVRVHLYVLVNISFFFLSTFECFFLGFSHQAYAAPLIRHSRCLDFPPTDELETRMEEQVDRGHISIEGAIIEGFFFAWY